MNHSNFNENSYVQNHSLNFEEKKNAFSYNHGPSNNNRGNLAQNPNLNAANNLNHMRFDAMNNLHNGFENFKDDHSKFLK